MGWPLRRRASSGRHASPRSGSWLQAASPDPSVAAPLAATASPVMVPASALVPASPLARAVPEQPMASVELGFRDGSTLSLAGESPHARALRAVADVLVSGRR